MVKATKQTQTGKTSQESLEEAGVSLVWEIGKYASISFSVGLFLTLILLRIPHTRRKLLSLAEQLADWHESGVQEKEDDDQWYKRAEKDPDEQ